MENAKKRTATLTEGPITGALLSFFFPVLLANLFQRLYNTVDSVIVGQFIGAEALASVGGSASLIIKLIIGVFTGLASGASIVTAQYYGGQDYKKLRNTVSTGIFFCLAAGAVLTVISTLLSYRMLVWAKEPADIIEASAKYLRIYFLGTVPQMVYNIGAGVLRAVGDSKRPFYYLLGTCALNVVLDLVFVGALRMGVAGAAWATVIAQSVSAALIVLNLWKTKAPYRLESIRPDGESLRQILRFGIPAGLQQVLFTVAELLMQTAVNGLGTVTVAAWSVTDKLTGILNAAANAFGTAISVFSGQTFGAGKYDRMKKGVGVCLLLGIGSIIVMAALMLTVGKYCMLAFTDDGEVIRYAVQRLWCIAPFYGLWTLVDILSGALRGAGDTVVPTCITAAGICGIRVIWCLIAVRYFNNIIGISFCHPISWLVTGAVYVIYWLSGGWLKRCIAKRDTATLTESKL